MPKLIRLVYFTTCGIGQVLRNQILVMKMLQPSLDTSALEAVASEWERDCREEFLANHRAETRAWTASREDSTTGGQGE